MKIKEITSGSRNDFRAVMECEHCAGTQQLDSGYHDSFYHSRVIPAMTCESCGKNRAGIVPDSDSEPWPTCYACNKPLVEDDVTGGLNCEGCEGAG